MKDLRPKNLNLFTIYFPIPAIVSITHRVTGVILFLFIPFFLFGLNYSLNINGFEQLRIWLGLAPVRVLLWLFLIPYYFHLVAGIRHLFMDIGFGSSIPVGRLTSWLTFIVTIVLTLITGILLW